MIMILRIAGVANIKAGDGLSLKLSLQVLIAARAALLLTTFNS